MTDQNETILIVDDEPLNLKILKPRLESKGYHIVEATNGSEGVEKAAEKPDLILLDIMMPGMDGFEVCCRLKKDEVTKEIPIIFLSAVHDTKTITTGLEVGGVDYVTKPVEAQELFARVKTHLTIRHQELQLRKYASKLENMVKERTMQLVHADRLATLGTFSAGIAHEINNPNTFISANVEALRLFWGMVHPIVDRHADEERKNRIRKFSIEMDDTLKGIQEGRRRISQIVSGLKSYAKQGGQSKKRYPLITPINDAIALLKHRLKYGVEVDISILPNLEIVCNMQEMSQVFVNLITNSLDAMDDDRGKITIKASRINDKVQITVEDSGPGIPEAVADRIFDPFFTTKERARGTGLGLSIVQGIIEEHRGEITLMPIDSHGAKFNIILPLFEK
jgi:signal transduction histidine kinase